MKKTFQTFQDPFHIITKSFKQNISFDTQQTSPISRSQDLFDVQNVKQKYNFKLSHNKDNHRHFLAHQDGGITCQDPKQIQKLRSVGKQMIKLIGRKILSGEFNLTKISIPIKSCYPKTALFNAVKGYSIFPYFMNCAAVCKDPLERFKMTLACLVAQPYYLNMFLKPLNPILGQTLQAKLSDGTKIYVQQISHHPPISYFLITDSQQNYRFSGYYDVQVQPGFNSLTIKNKGKRKFTFKDGSQIETTYSTNEFSGTFFGKSRVEQLNSFKIVDTTNKIECIIEYGKLKKKASDHFASKIIMNGKVECQIQGTYLGYLNIDGKRYWDGRELEELKFIYESLQKRLPSDWQNRQDIKAVQKNDLQKGQKYKEQLQQRQRQDTKLRKKYEKTLKENKN